MVRSRLMRSHEQRSSSLSYALRWKYGKWRLFKLTVMITAALVFMFTILFQHESGKKIKLILNGQEIVFYTKHEVLQNVLDDQQIRVGIFDVVSLPLTSKVSDGEVITIDRSVPIFVKADGETKRVYTSKNTVVAALNQAEVKVGLDDIVEPVSWTKVKKDMVVTIVRVTKTFTKKEYPIAYEVVEQKDPAIELGKKKVVQQGKKGVIVEKYESVYKDNKIVSKRLVSKVTTAEPIDQIVAVGTLKEEVVATNTDVLPATKFTRNGISAQAKKVLQNVTLTAYTASFSSTGKRATDPGFGRTASGTKVRQGRTIAVDTRVIPMGWWVYIDGLGLYRAEDRGSSVSGHKIDVYYDTEYQARKFGRKRGFTVYIIGPNKPKSI